MKEILSALGMLTITITLLLALLALTAAPFFNGWPAIALFPVVVFILVAICVVFVIGFSLTIKLLVGR